MKVKCHINDPICPNYNIYNISPTWIFTEIKGISLPKNTPKLLWRSAANDMWPDPTVEWKFPPLIFVEHLRSISSSNCRANIQWSPLAMDRIAAPKLTCRNFGCLFFQALKYVSFPNVACFLHTCNMFGPKNSSECLFVKHGNLLKDVFVLLSDTFGTKHITGSHQRTLPYSCFTHLIRLEVEIVNHLQQVETLLPKVAPDWSNVGNPTTFPGEVGTICSTQKWRLGMGTWHMSRAMPWEKLPASMSIYTPWN